MANVSPPIDPQVEGIVVPRWRVIAKYEQLRAKAKKEAGWAPDAPVDDAKLGIPPLKLDTMSFLKGKTLFRAVVLHVIGEYHATVCAPFPSEPRLRRA